VQPLHRLARRRFHRIGDRQQTRGPSVYRGEHHGLTARAQFVGPRRKSSSIDAELIEQLRRPDSDRTRADHPCDSFSRDGGKSPRRLQVEAPLFGRTDDSAAQRMLARTLQACGQPQ
jgi:hypothetical protein